MRNLTIAFLLGISVLSCTVKAQSIRMRMPDTTGFTGNTIDVPVYVDSSLTGKNIVSYQLKINFNNYYLTVLNVLNSGTLTSGFSAPAYSVNGSSLMISSAGSVPLSGKGVLLYIRFQMIQSGGGTVSFTGTNDCYFNQGIPVMTFINSYLVAQAPPTINAYYATSGPLTVGDSTQVYVSGGTSPYTYQVTNTAVATISSTGMLKSIAPGKTKVRVQSANALVDTTNNDIEFRAILLSLPDTTVLPLANVILPVRSNSTTSSTILSGSFRINYSQGSLVVDSIITTGTLLQNASVSYQNFPGYSLVSFARSTPLTGAGDLINLRFRILNPTYSSLTLQDILFNQNIPANQKNGSLNITPVPALYISPTYGDFYSGDQQQFTATGGRPPYQFSTTDTAKGTISLAGMFTAKKGGQVRAKVKDSLNNENQTAVLQVYDALLSFPSMPVLSGSTVNYPVFLSKMTGNSPIYSMQLTIGFGTNMFDSLDVVLTNTLSTSWSVTQNVQASQIIIAIAGTTPITTNGILFRLRAKIKAGLSNGTNINLSPTGLLFNEGGFVGNVLSGNMNVVITLQKDIGVNASPGLGSACSKSNQETIAGNLYNYNNVTYFIGDQIIVGYKINSGPVIKDTLTLISNLSNGSNYPFTFKQKANFTIPGSYTIKVFSELPGDLNLANDTFQTTFQIYGTPVVNIGNDTAFCAGNTLLLNATTPSSSYLWSNNSTTPTIAVDTTGVFWVKVTSSNNCVVYDTIQVTVRQIPTAQKLSGTAYIGTCGLDSIRLTTVAIPGGAYRWLFNGSNTTNIGDTLDYFMVKTSGIYSVKVTNNFGCSKTMPDTIISLAGTRQPAAAIITTGNFCEGDTLKLSPSILSGVGYRWSGPGGFVSTQPNVLIPNAGVSQSGTYSLYIHKTGASVSCDTSVTTQQTVLVNVKPVIQNLQVQGGLSFCPGDSVILSVAQGFKYRWLRNGLNTSNPADTLDQLVVKLSGTYGVLLTNANGCSNKMRDTLVTANPKPLTSAITGNSNVLINATQNYNVTNTPGSTYTWQITNGLQTAGSTTNAITVQWMASVGNGSVKVIETSGAGCIGDTISKSISITAVVPDSLSLNTDTLYFTSAGSTQNVSLTSNRTWTISNPASWFVVNPMIGSNNATIAVTVQNNTSGADRMATFTVTAGSLTKNVTVKQTKSTTGLSDMEQTKYVQLYPNPSNGQFVIKNNAAFIFKGSILDVKGQLLYEFEIESNASKLIQALDLPTGIYQISLTSDSQYETYKLVICK